MIPTPPAMRETNATNAEKKSLSRDRHAWLEKYHESFTKAELRDLLNVSRTVLSKMFKTLGIEHKDAKETRTVKPTSPQEFTRLMSHWNIR